MKKYLLIILVFISCSVYAQMDVVVLKNGSEIRGIVVEKTEETIKLKSKDGSIWVFEQENVVEIKPFRPVAAESGFYNIFSFGLFGGSDVSGNLTIVNGYRFNPHWSAGLGIGVEAFYDRNYAPIFLEGKYNLLKKGSTPFINIGFGYDLPFEYTKINKGGFFGQGLIGIQHELGQHFGIITGIGFRYGQLQVQNWNWWGGIDGNIKTIYEINRFDFRFGFIFR